MSKTVDNQAPSWRCSSVIDERRPLAQIRPGVRYDDQVVLLRCDRRDLMHRVLGTHHYVRLPGRTIQWSRSVARVHVAKLPAHPLVQLVARACLLLAVAFPVALGIVNGAVGASIGAVLGVPVLVLWAHMEGP